MIKSTIFREYDIRGIFKDELNEKSVKLIGYFFGLEMLKRDATSNCVVIGYDARTHCNTLLEYLTSGLNKAGCEVLNMNMVATGVNYFANYQDFEGKNIGASIMITGSHNPPQYNGFKMTINKVPFFADEIYDLGKKIIENQTLEIPDNTSKTEIDVKTLYIDYIANQFQHLKNLKGKFVFDCGNGVANTVLEDILDKLNIKHKLLFKQPDGTFPNHHPDPSEEKNLKVLISELKNDYDYGFAYDGDADRIAFLTKQNNIKGDMLALIFAKTMQNPTVIGEVKCSQIMYDEINKFGKAVMYKTGHSNLKIKIKELNATFAAEVSGHIFFNDRYFGFDDAIYATFRILELIKDGVDFDAELSKIPKVYSTDELKINTTEEDKFKIIDQIKILLKKTPKDFPKILDIIEIDGVRIVFEDGWALVRASNTTPVLVTRFESTNQQHVELYQQATNDIIKLASKSI